MKRVLAAVLSVPVLLLVVAAPAQAAARDAKGCENTQAGPLAGYCETNP